MRLIDADALKNNIMDLMPSGSVRGLFKELVDDQPTAYDLDKVVEQIKSLSPANYVSKDDVLKIVKGDNFSHSSEKNSFFDFDEVIRIECEKARSKAIDDFTNELKLKCLENMYHSVTLQQIFEIKEQLKGGEQDESKKM